MLGILVQLAVSWIIIWVFEKGTLNVLGFWPTRQRLLDFGTFMVITSFLCSTGFLLRMYFGKETWEVNPDLTSRLVFDGLWWNIKSVLFEELIFRGVLFYILITRFGHLKAILVSSAAFGVYHWFSQGSLGNPVGMLITFLLTGTMGLLYAYGYAKTFSLYVPCAIHLGWNFTQGFIFSSGSIGKGILIQPGPQPVVNVGYFIYALVVFFPMVSTLVINFLLLRRKQQVLMEKTE
jgi:membrane protease YdiL (CAAX protease family)